MRHRFDKLHRRQLYFFYRLQRIQAKNRFIIQRKGHLKGKKHQVLNQLNFTVEVRAFSILLTDSMNCARGKE